MKGETRLWPGESLKASGLSFVFIYDILEHSKIIFPRSWANKEDG
jgi:hypothetical protein